MRLETLCVHAGTGPDPVTGGITAPELPIDVALEGGGQVDRRGDAAGHGIRSGAGVDAEGL